MPREPVLKPVPISSLRPTQITVGFREVEIRRRMLREGKKMAAPKFYERHMIPVVLGPGEHHYVLDHHHLALALHEEGVKQMFVTVIADLSKVDEGSFWLYLAHKAWLHPYDAKGRRRDHTDIPKRLADMSDDPFRSLAGALRRAGGYAKDTTPFSEFLWADFLRRRVKTSLVRHRFDKALERALTLAKSKDADYLPGWCGAIEDG